MGGGTLVLARLRADSRLLIACTVLITLVALVLAGLMSLDRESRTNGLRQRLTSLPAARQAVTITVPSDAPMTAAGPADGAQDEVLRADVEAALPGVPVHVLASARTAPRGVLGNPVAGAGRVVLMAYEDLPALAELVNGAWPAGPGGDEATLQADAASALGVEVGDTVQVDLEAPAALTVVGTWRIRPQAHGGVGGSVLETTGRQTADTVGPLVPADPSLLQASQRVWVVQPDVARLDLSVTEALAAQLGGLEDRIRRDPRLPGANVRDDLREALGPAARQAGRTSPAGQVALVLVGVVAVAALLVVGRLLAQSRAAHTALLRARGAAWGQVAAWTALELGVLCAPIVVVAVGVLLIGRQREAALLLACALLAVALLAVPLLLASRRRQAAQAETGEARRAAAARWGVELLVLSGAAVAAWQLHRNGSGPSGEGLDPVVVLAPALTLLAGALITARLMVLASGAATRGLARRQRPSALLAAWQISRSPGPHVVAVVLIVMLVGSAVLVVGERATRSDQQRRVAEQRVGADVRVVASSPTGPSRDAAVELSAALADLTGVSQVRGIAAEPASSAAGTFTLLAVTDPRPAASGTGAPGQPLLGASAGATVEVAYSATLDSGPSNEPPPAPGEVAAAPAPLSARLSTWWLSPQGYVVSRDLETLVVENEPRTRTAEQRTLEVSLPELPGAVEQARWELVALDVRIDRSINIDQTMTVSIDALTERGAGPVATSDLAGSPWRLVPLQAEGSDQASFVGSDLPAVAATLRAPFGASHIRALARPEGDPLPGVEIPYAVAVTQDLARALGVQEGSTLRVKRVAPMEVTIREVRGAVPGTAGPAMVLDARDLAVADLVAGDGPVAQEQWALALDPAATDGTSASVAEDVAGAAAAVGVPVDVQDRRRVLRDLVEDPLSTGSSRLLLMAGVAVAVLALAGVLAGGASAARLRRRDETLLSVLGADSRQQKRAGAVRGAILAVLSGVAGLGTGVVVVVLSAPALVGDAASLSAAAPVQAQVPWLPVLVVAGLGMVLAALTTAATTSAARRPLSRRTREEGL